VDTKVSTGDKTRESKCVQGVHIKQGIERKFLAQVFILTKLIILAEHKKKP
jgi:hypothetical protein